MCVCVFYAFGIQLLYTNVKVQRADRKNKSSLEIWTQRSIDALDHKNDEYEGPRTLN